MKSSNLEPKKEDDATNIKGLETPRYGRDNLDKEVDAEIDDNGLIDVNAEIDDDNDELRFINYRKGSMKYNYGNYIRNHRQRSQKMQIKKKIKLN